MNVGVDRLRLLVMVLLLRLTRAMDIDWILSGSATMDAGLTCLVDPAPATPSPQAPWRRDSSTQTMVDLTPRGSNSHLIQGFVRHMVEMTTIRLKDPGTKFIAPTSTDSFSLTQFSEIDMSKASLLLVNQSGTVTITQHSSVITIGAQFLLKASAHLSIRDYSSAMARHCSILMGTQALMFISDHSALKLYGPLQAEKDIHESLTLQTLVLVEIIRYSQIQIGDFASISAESSAMLKVRDHSSLKLEKGEHTRLVMHANAGLLMDQHSSINLDGVTLLIPSRVQLKLLKNARLDSGKLGKRYPGTICVLVVQRTFEDVFIDLGLEKQLITETDIICDDNQQHLIGRLRMSELNKDKQSEVAQAITSLSSQIDHKKTSHKHAEYATLARSSLAQDRMHQCATQPPKEHDGGPAYDFPSPCGVSSHSCSGSHAVYLLLSLIVRCSVSPSAFVEQ